MSLSEEKTKRIELLEQTRRRRAELQGHLEGLQDQLATERAAKLSGDGKGAKIPSLQKAIAKLGEELASLQVDEVLERQIQELERQEHEERVREAEEQRNAAIQSLEEAVGAYREKRLELLEAASRLDEARERARGVHMHWMQLTGTPYSPTLICLYPWDSGQLQALRILQGVVDSFKRAEELEELRARNPQLYNVPAASIVQLSPEEMRAEHDKARAAKRARE